jgi:hypothetical protein
MIIKFKMVFWFIQKIKDRNYTELQGKSHIIINYMFLNFRLWLEIL